ncbi:ABC transporter ATP-binding protein [Jeongeupia chitinilytica]|uniref:Sugar ABC transporter ATP-binding protein n=1 Tax=Jeongeupia chitinilytica TaxID=1041641 RepID=A0ABQ3H3A6_9NEIS|nr:ABC transporter ATP-binding protein [Jeongeupia chitinilytica]GHD67442.1 sugar ABC transporter ATP-binding protein [Jeongeupia chitinilytica]
MSSNCVIEVKMLSKHYDVYDSPLHRMWVSFFPKLAGNSKKFHALDDVNFTIKKGETVGIIGRNGSGKSTLLQLICGTLTPSLGGVSVNGRIAALLELGSGFNPEFSGRENVYLNAAILGLTPKEIEQKFSDIERFADIGDFIDQPIKTYSSGMVVRLAFATAIHVSPDILVVDEALAVGDTAFQQKCLNRIRDMQRQGVSILLVTHSSNTLIEYCDRGIYLKKGRLIMDAACRDVVRRYADDLVEQEGGMVVEIDQASEVGVANATSVSQPMQIRQDDGQGRLSVQSVELRNAKGELSANYQFGEAFAVQIKVKAEGAVDIPCFGVQLSSVDGIVLWSGTTQSMNLELPVMVDGIYTVKWNMQANFSGNRYILAVGVGRIESGDYLRTHRVDYAGHFDIIPVAHSGGGWLAPCPVFEVI